MAKKFLAGVARALLFANNELIAVCKTLTESTFNFAIENEEVRAGAANGLWGKYFHDSALNLTITDAMFSLEYMALNLGVDINQGGIILYESAATGETVAAGGTITLANAPVAFDGSIIAWYKKPADANWTIGTVTGSTLTIGGAQAGDKYCVKYFYQNANARSLKIKTQYVPKVVHIVLLNDLFSGETADVGSATKYGRLIVDIPSFQLDGSNEISLTSSSVGNISLSGSALAVDEGDSCEEDPYYGTMTEEIFGADWKANVRALAPVPSDITMKVSTNTTIDVYGVFGGMTASKKLNNADLTFAVDSGSAVTVGANTGVITAKSTAGDAVVSVKLTGTEVDPAFVHITVEQ